jgi:flagellar basal body rod protein FlgG
MDHLDRLATDIANAGTSGYKAERATTTAAERPTFDQALQSAVDVAPGPGKYDFRAGSIAATGRTLDVALSGPGFFTVQTPGGARYTRNGHFERSADGTLVTEDGMAVLGDSGPIQLGKGDLTIESDGTIRSDAGVAGKLQVVTFDDTTTLEREGNSRFAADPSKATAVKNPDVQPGALEKSNVSMVERIAELTEVTRTFEALQKGVSVIMNDIDGRAISELGRR